MNILMVLLASVIIYLVFGFRVGNIIGVLGVINEHRREEYGQANQKPHMTLGVYIRDQVGISPLMGSREKFITTVGLFIRSIPISTTNIAIVCIRKQKSMSMEMGACNNKVVKRKISEKEPQQQYWSWSYGSNSTQVLQGPITIIWEIQ